MEITLEEAFTGKTAEIRVPASMTCEDCSGTGAKPGTQPTTCSMCSGTGRVRATQGFFSIERTCPQCQGRGQTIEDPCPKCSGQGRVVEERSLSVNIPAGIEDGTRIRLAGEGEAGLRGGPSGDLYIFLSVKPHEFFQRDGADLYCKVPISMTTAALGGAFEVTDARRHADPRQGARGHPERAPVPPQGQGHAGAAAGQYGRSLHPGRRRDAAEPDQAPARTAGGVRGAVLQRRTARNPPAFSAA
jgi:hypothetical protein